MQNFRKDYLASPFALTPQMLLLVSSAVYFIPFAFGGFQYVDVGGRKYDFVYHAGTGYAIALSISCIMKYDYTLPCSNLWLVPLSFIPFSDSVFGKDGCTYNEQVQPFLFPGYSGGVAANIWAEFYANFGYAGFPLFIVIISLACVAIEATIRNVRSATLKAGLIVAIIHLTFYIQRKDLLGAFISAKRVILVSLFIFGLVHLHRKCFAPVPAQVRSPREMRALRQDHG